MKHNMLHIITLPFDVGFKRVKSNNRAIIGRAPLRGDIMLSAIYRSFDQLVLIEKKSKTGDHCDLNKTLHFRLSVDSVIIKQNDLTGINNSRKLL